MKIFSNHRRKLEPHRRYGGREFKDKLVAAKNYKRNFNSNKESFVSAFFSRAGMSQAAVYTTLVFIGAIFYFLVISPYFLVTQVSVSGNKQVSSDEIVSAIQNAANHRFMLVKKNSFFLLNSGVVNKIIVSADPLVRVTKSSRSWPNKLKIEVIERTPTLVLAANQKYYLVDDQGFVIKEVPDSGNYLKVSDQVGEDIKVGETIDGKLIPFIISMKQIWPTRLTQAIAAVKIPGKGATEVEFVTSEGWSVFFSTDRPVVSQLGNLVILLNKQIGSDRSKLAYIDLRIAKWAYYCFKDTPCQQSDQQGLAQQQLQSQSANNPTPAQTSGTNTINANSTK